MHIILIANLKSVEKSQAKLMKNVAVKRKGIFHGKKNGKASFRRINRGINISQKT